VIADGYRLWAVLIPPSLLPNRAGRPDTPAWRWSASDAAPFISETVIPVDGGRF